MDNSALQDQGFLDENETEESYSPGNQKDGKTTENENETLLKISAFF